MLTGKSEEAFVVCYSLYKKEKLCVYIYTENLWNDSQETSNIFSWVEKLGG